MTYNWDSKKEVREKINLSYGLIRSEKKKIFIK